MRCGSKTGGEGGEGMRWEKVGGSGWSYGGLSALKHPGTQTSN